MYITLNISFDMMVQQYIGILTGYDEGNKAIIEKKKAQVVADFICQFKEKKLFHLR